MGKLLSGCLTIIVSAILLIVSLGISYIALVKLGVF